MSALLLLGLGAVTVLWPLAGLVGLLLLACTWNLGIEVLSWSLPGLGIVLPEDVLACALAAATARRAISPRWRGTRGYTAFLLAGAFGAAALALFLSGAIGPNDAYRLVVRNAVLWFLPALILRLTAAEAAGLLWASMGTALLVSGFQWFALASADASLVVRSYYQYARFGEDAQRIVNAAIRSGERLRLYPNGALLVQMMLPVALYRSLASRRDGALLRALCGACAIAMSWFLLSLRGRATDAAFLVSVIAVAWVAVRRARSWALGACVVLALAVTVGANWSGVVSTWSATIETRQIDTAFARESDNVAALQVILEHPLTGVGKSDAVDRTEYGTGHDVHGLLAVALLGGVMPAVLLAVWLLLTLKAWLKAVKSGVSADVVALTEGALALVPALFLTLVNATPAVVGVRNILPFSIGLGLVLRGIGSVTAQTQPWRRARAAVGVRRAWSRAYPARGSR
jgi:hypothetical protein